MDAPIDAGWHALQQLCAHFGIATHYLDIWGNHHPVSPQTLSALLQEFDVHLGEPADGAGAVLADLQRAAWHQVLPPVVTMEALVPSWRLHLRLPASTQWLHWHLCEEAGALHEASVDATRLVEVSRTEHDGVVWVERELALALPLPAGYHRLRLDGVAGETLVISAPARCYRPPALQGGGRVWGPSLQLYALRSAHNWGIGDFSDLVQLIEQMADLGADMVGLNPLHALFSHNPAHASPYSPSSRQLLNVLYIDVEAVHDLVACEPALQKVRSQSFQVRLNALRDAPLVDYVGVAAAKLEVLALLFAHFQVQHLSADGHRPQSPAGADFLEFVAQRGEALYRHALFEALQAQFHAADASVWGWQAWPVAYQDPQGAAVQAFAQNHQECIRYHLYLQWLAAGQLARASAVARGRSMGVGLYVDLAVSADRGGADVWGARDCFAANASVGAPPDEFNLNGQGWGLPPLRPDRLRASQYRFFIETLRDNMRGAGALRIDHVMGLMRLFWIPPGQTPRQGTYVHYPLAELLAIVTLESQRNQCVVVGEDLGTVADEVRVALAARDVLSYRLLYFERQHGGEFKPPQDYPANALVAVGTHDLATLAGWWAGQDLALRQELGLFSQPQMLAQQLLARAQDRVRLLLAVYQAGLVSIETLVQAASSQVLPEPAVAAIHAFLARTPAALMLVQLEDALGVLTQVNVPGTVNEQPNWRRKLPLDLACLASGELLQSLAHSVSRERS
jgi:(1->4)-alpha-D-glucan 1-alpha-D-glucosylmutase